MEQTVYYPVPFGNLNPHDRHFLLSGDIMFDEYGDILPYVGLGGLKLYTNLCCLKEMVEKSKLIFSEPFLRYDYQDFVSMFFCRKIKSCFD